MIKVMYFGHQTDMAGGEISLLQLIDSIDKTAVKPEIIIPGPGRFKNELEKRRELKKHELHLPDEFVKGTAQSYESGGIAKKAYSVVHLVKTALQLRSILKQEKPDILHTNTLKAAVIATMATFMGKTKHIYHDRTHTYNVANRMIYRRAEKIIAISDFVRSKYEGLDKSKIVRVYNGVKNKQLGKDEFQLREAYGIGGDEVLIGVVGRIVPWKGHRTFIEAAINLMKGSSQKFKFIIIGSAEIEASEGYENEIKQLIDNSGFKENFIFTGYRTDVQNLMSQLNVLVVPSIEEEAFGRVIIEGQMSNVIVVASRIGGIPELIVDNETGLLFRPGDSSELTEKLQRILRDPEWALRIRDKGYASAHENFNIDIHSARIKRVYEELHYGS
ncbi:glycosyltransferase family 4 protein [Paenibacillus xanthanilyticus]|uniref:Glycosyltransferase family 4 protein n=1 Tax=Paenibacillus xanthanilyticus TaxID=1783531 RepID=A0ABV8KAY8_9BACL